MWQIDREHDSGVDFNDEITLRLRIKELKITEKNFITLQKDHQTLLAAHGQYLVEQTAKENKEKRSKNFQKIYGRTSTVERNHESSSSNVRGVYPLLLTQDCLSPMTQRDAALPSMQDDPHPSTPRDALIPSTRDEDTAIPTQVGDSKLSPPEANPTKSPAVNLEKPYETLLVTIPKVLHTSDKKELKNWAKRFSLPDSQSAEQIIFQIDRKRLISASNLSHLKEFFESINRFDLLYVIDGFLQGDYSCLQQVLESRGEAQSR